MHQKGKTTSTNDQVGDDIVARAITSVDELEAIADEWRDLAHRQTDPLSYFQSADWCLSWCRAAVNATGEEPELHTQTLWQGDRLVCIVPLMSQRKYGLNNLVALGAPEGQYSGCMIDQAMMDRTVVEEWMAGLRKQSRFDCVLFDDLPASSALVPQTQSSGITFNPENATMVMDLSGFEKPEDVDAAMTAKSRKNQKTKMKRLARHGEVELEVLHGGETQYKNALRLAMEWKRSWLEDKGQPLAADRDERLHAQLADLPMERGAADQPVQGAIMFVLRVGGQSVAKEVGFVQGRHYYSYLGAYDPEWAARSVGTIQIGLTRKWAVEQGIHTYDFLGSSEYKSHQTNHEIPLVSVAVPLSMKGHIYAALWLRQLRPSFYRVFQNMGPGLKRPIVRLRELIHSLRGSDQNKPSFQTGQGG
ncbi:GNAT family N-acetyltransferase [Ahrensia sp. R2A130]|uniref:GNAT family N-acetyltransferase n=1 Tax=Ahrensia sp. R2A130 TaxID=744979 RepID=UPI0001E0E09E|nr:GNAT family N-acetyltransferase [Ahrensia sp. R2A130]EFL89322.1 putative cellulose biosynthesis protein CelD [Ahrensia sp. R2A130]